MKSKYFSTMFLVLTGALIFLNSCGNDDSPTMDDMDDMDEDFTATITITPGPTATVNEDDGSLSITITLSETNTSGETLTIPFSVSGTASANDDYQVSGNSVAIQNEESGVSLEIVIIDDSDVEEDETIVFTLGTLPEELIEGANTELSITISDDDEAVSNAVALEIVFGTSTGNSINVESWTDLEADNYAILINTESTFAPLTSSSNLLASTTYVGYGEQVVYYGSAITSFDVSLLASTSEYYLKLVPETSGSFDMEIESFSAETIDCETTSTSMGQVCFDYTGEIRTISSNQLANHDVGNFPNADPTAIQVVRELDISPTYTGSAIYVYDETGPPTPSNDNFWQFGMAINGVEFHPMGLKPWENPDNGEENWEWQAKVTEEGETNLDAFGAHVTSMGNYHYHGDIVGLASDEDGTRHSLIYGYAADGFPIYYKYGYSVSDDPTSSIIELESSYQLKTGARTGTGVAGKDYPDGNHDGTYIQDFEYVENLGDLDECNGREGVTPEFPEGTYYYVITSDFPVTPNCFFGTPAEDWKIGM